MDAAQENQPPKPQNSERSFSDSDRRYFRYKRIVEWVTEQVEFQLDQAQQAIYDERPGFVTRVVKELEADGFIVRPARESRRFRWNPGIEFQPTRWLDDKMFGSQIKESPEQDRPRERLLSLGAEKLSNAELIAILIRSGRPGESAVMGGQKVARAYQGRLETLPTAGRAELKSISRAVEKTAYCQIMAGIELGRRIGVLTDTRISQRISSSGDAIEFCKRQFDRLATDRKQEEFHIVTLDTKNQVVDTHQITIGTLDASLVHPREVFRAAIRDAASSVILVHNHPSGDPTPSREDFAVTRRLTEAGKLIGIDVLDHIVVGNPDCVSIREVE